MAFYAEQVLVWLLLWASFTAIAVAIASAPLIAAAQLVVVPYIWWRERPLTPHEHGMISRIERPYGLCAVALAALLMGYLALWQPAWIVFWDSPIIIAVAAFANIYNGLKGRPGAAENGYAGLGAVH